MQNSFLGGEWSPRNQGKSDEAAYYTAMNLCLNYVPTDEGAATRRGGFRLSAEARANIASLISFYTAGGVSYQCELTDLVMRFHTTGVVVDSLPRIKVASISTATPAVVKTASANGFSSNQTVIFNDLGPETGPLLYQRQYKITVLTSTTFSIAHTGSLGTGPVDGSVFSGLALTSEVVSKIREETTPYLAAQLSDIRHTEEADNLYLFHQSHEPQILDGPLLTLTEQSFSDGPFFALNKSATTLAFSALTGSVTVTASAALFTLVTDVGRHIRVNTGTVAAPSWSWLKITAVGSTTSATATVSGDDLAVGTATALWRLGVYSDTTGWPKHGVVHEGRLWLIADHIPGRVDGSVPFDFFNFSPTSADGTVPDSAGVSGTVAGIGRKNFRWLKVSDDGLLAGSDSAEWLVRASALDDPITGFTLQIRRQTKYGSADVLPVEAGRNTLFVQSLGRALIEYRKDGAKYDGNDIARTGRHLTSAGITQLAYSAIPTPIIWGLRSDQRLIGVTYRNDLEGKQTGWHQHNIAWADDPFDTDELAQQRHVYANALGPVLDISVAPFSDFETTRNDTLWAVVLRNGQACVEYMTELFNESLGPNEAFHVDSGNVYKREDLGATWVNISGNTYRFYGLDRLIGDTVDISYRGVCQTPIVVAADGTADVTLAVELDAVASAYETSTRAQIGIGGLTFSSLFVSEARSATPNTVGDPCAQSVITVGEDLNRYYVRGGIGGVGGDDGTVLIYDADTGTVTVAKTEVTLDSEGNAAGITPSPDNGVGLSGAVAVTIPETPYIIIIIGGASGVDSSKMVLYYKMDSGSLLTLVGGFSVSEDDLSVQASPPDAFGNSLEAAGWAPIGSGDPGSNNNFPYKHPVVLGWFGEARSTLIVVPSINWIISNTATNITDTDPWADDMEKPLSLTDFGANIFNVQDGPEAGALKSSGFSLPIAGGSGSYFCMMFYTGDLIAHDAGTETVTNTFLDTHATTYLTGLISAVRLTTRLSTSLDTTLESAIGLSASYGSTIVDFHARFENSDGTAAFPFPDEGLDFDGVAGVTNENYSCNPTVYPSDLTDPDAPHFLFFYRTYRKAGDRDKGGVRIFKWDPKTLKATFLDFKKGQIFTLTTDVAAGTEIIQGNVQWDRATNQMTLLLKSSEAGADAHIVAEFGTFDPVTETITVTAEGHVDAVAGLNYASRGQLLRPDLNSGVQNGPALGKKRRTDRFNVLVDRSGGMNFGTKFEDLILLPFGEIDSVGRRPLFSGVTDIRSLQDTYSFDSMMIFEQTKPETGTIVAIAGHISVNDI